MSDVEVNIEDLKERLERTIDYVRDCSVRVGNGEIMDLTGLDKTVTKMCEDIEKLPKDDADSVKDDMAKLVGGLDDLAGNIEKHAEG